MGALDQRPQALPLVAVELHDVGVAEQTARHLRLAVEPHKRDAYTPPPMRWKSLDPFEIDIFALQVLNSLPGGTYFPWTSWSMRPSDLVTTLNEVLLNRRSRILELGSGASTLYIARLLRQYGGHLHTVEHDDRGHELIAHAVGAENLAEWVTPLHAPLEPTEPSLGGVPWYSGRELAGLASDNEFDLLIVDGPPQHRYPAVPYFRESLADDYAVILDDASRPGELEILGRWQTELGIPFQQGPGKSAIAIGRSRESHWFLEISSPSPG
jgi:hypothetical protein